MLMDEKTGEVETFVAGRDKEKGENLQFRDVMPGTWVAMYLLPDNDDDNDGFAEGKGKRESKGLEEGFIIAEGAVPGYKVLDDDFLTVEGLKALKGKEGAKEWLWLLHKAERQKVGLP